MLGVFPKRRKQAKNNIIAQQGKYVKDMFLKSYGHTITKNIK